MNQTVLKVSLVAFAFFVSFNTIVAQSDGNNAITTAAPFLNINPDSRAAGMADAGVATSPDMNSQFLNPAKYAFMEEEMGVSVSFTPWLRKLVNDINMSTATFYYRLDKMQTVSASLRYFSMGTIEFTDGIGTPLYSGKPNEFAIDAAYSRVLSDKFSGAVAFRYIRSDLTNGYSETGDLQAGNAFAADMAFYFKQPMKVNRNDAEFTAGINISNIGSKISYDGINKEYIPTNLKLGAGYAMELDKYNSISFALDINKLLVPSNQIRPDDAGENWVDPNEGKSVPAAIFGSFNDAPGGFQQEMQEVTFSLGAEYWYDKQFAIRAGYFHEHENQGNRKFASAGFGLKFNMFTLDASYIIPMVQNNPLANTMRFSLSFDLSDMR
ncbi:type IX secretion system outer membrane channel protein PorV [Carboxylicivirga sediminis]|uniref:Type IX secretion system outer membrane channel protein PorV n=1 Tax=Carboxylicivirga sediminis TaxID=2006564 RepID=A0A941F6X5_9BACT|nr:type IX secretion system outer membrane channel protein PorV [Carboxylicivirga sediminis]MBR8536779.1 type IX secretion system outer membrane channel protein PorV [Carboxylicivirga sediminis]